MCFRCLFRFSPFWDLRFLSPEKIKLFQRFLAHKCTRTPVTEIFLEKQFFWDPCMFSWLIRFISSNKIITTLCSNYKGQSIFEKRHLTSFCEVNKYDYHQSYLEMYFDRPVILPYTDWGNMNYVTSVSYENCYETIEKPKYLNELILGSHSWMQAFFGPIIFNGKGNINGKWRSTEEFTSLVAAYWQKRQIEIEKLARNGLSNFFKICDKLTTLLIL